ncbi:MAG: HutP family protein [Eubacteriales bacterium]|nr:HutP family protein [Eubacteriales bacterium]
MQDTTSREVCRAAVTLALSRDRDEEQTLKDTYRAQGMGTAAVDHGGEFVSSVAKMVERTVVAAKREGLIGSHHNEEGAVAGAVREAISQISAKSIGLNVGGKIGIARQDDHVAVCIFAAIGLLHLNENAIGMGHRAI